LAATDRPPVAAPGVAWKSGTRLPSMKATSVFSSKKRSISGPFSRKAATLGSPAAAPISLSR
jgi:hypothetical protein